MQGAAETLTFSLKDTGTPDNNNKGFVVAKLDRLQDLTGTTVTTHTLYIASVHSSFLVTAGAVFGTSLALTTFKVPKYKVPQVWKSWAFKGLVIQDYVEYPATATTPSIHPYGTSATLVVEAAVVPAPTYSITRPIDFVIRVRPTLLLLEKGEVVITLPTFDTSQTLDPWCSVDGKLAGTYTCETDSNNKLRIKGYTEYALASPALLVRGRVAATAAFASATITITAKTYGVAGDDTSGIETATADATIPSFAIVAGKPQLKVGIKTWFGAQSEAAHANPTELRFNIKPRAPYAYKYPIILKIKDSTALPTVATLQCVFTDGKNFVPA